MNGMITGTALSTDYLMLSGTSMATPMVSAAAAMMIQRDPTLKPDEVKSRLMKTAAKLVRPSETFLDVITCQTYTSQYDIFTVGAGYLDVNAALANTSYGAIISFGARTSSGAKAPSAASILSGVRPLPTVLPRWVRKTSRPREFSRVVKVVALPPSLAKASTPAVARCSNTNRPSAPQKKETPNGASFFAYASAQLTISSTRASTRGDSFAGLLR